jgi:hypothetical protein
MNRETLRERILKKDYKDINNWDVSDITDMSRMFYVAFINMVCILVTLLTSQPPMS